MERTDTSWTMVIPWRVAVTVLVICWTFVLNSVSPVSVTSINPGKSEVSMTDSMSYLEQFGYLPADDHKTASLRTEESFSAALRDFQRMAGIPLTGILDKATQEMMALPRCGNKDHEMPGTRSLRKKRYALQGSKWARPDITYKISAYPRGVSREEADNEVYSALKIWGDVTNLNFIQRPQNRKVDINVLFTRRAHGDGNPFDGRGRTLAHAFFPQYGGDAHFDNDEDWTVNVESGINMFQVAAHEFGHSLGLSHSRTRSALMAPFYRGYQKDFQLDLDDVRGIQQLYGPPITKIPRRQPSGSRPDSEDGPVLSVPELCVEPKIDAMFTGSGHDTYIFRGNQYYKIEPWGIAKGYPRLISDDWYPLKGPIDSALYWANGYTYLFKGSHYYKFYGRNFKYSRSIRSGFMGIPDNVDASFVWSKNKITYFIKGDQYWRYSTNQADPDYPKPLRLWGKGMPSRVDAAVRWRNDKTYFFRGDSYYRYNDYEFMVEDSYPRPTAQWWLGCPDKDQVQHINQIRDLYGPPQRPYPDLYGGQSDYSLFPASSKHSQSEMTTDSPLGVLDQLNPTMESPLESSKKEADAPVDSPPSGGGHPLPDGSGFLENSKNSAVVILSGFYSIVSFYSVLIVLLTSWMVRRCS